MKQTCHTVCIQCLFKIVFKIFIVECITTKLFNTNTPIQIFKYLRTVSTITLVIIVEHNDGK